MVAAAAAVSMDMWRRRGRPAGAGTGMWISAVAGGAWRPVAVMVITPIGRGGKKRIPAISVSGQS